MQRHLFISNTNDVLYTTAKKENSRTKPNRSWNSGNTRRFERLHLDADGNVRLAISPDGDGNKDYAVPCSRLAET